MTKHKMLILFISKLTAQFVQTDETATILSHLKIRLSEKLQRSLGQPVWALCARGVLSLLLMEVHIDVQLFMFIGRRVNIYIFQSNIRWRIKHPDCDHSGRIFTSNTIFKMPT